MNNSPNSLLIQSGSSDIIKNGTDCKAHMNFSHSLFFLFISLAILVAIISTPVLAGTKYMSGSPNLSVSIAGNNEFTPGNTVSLKLQIQNNGLNQIKFVQSGIVETDDSPNTAKMVKVSLLSDDSPILIKSDPQMIGDIKGSQSVPASFEVRIPDEAKAGKYTLPVVLDYTYLGNAEQEGTDTITYRYINKKMEVDLPFVVKSAINLDVVGVSADNISAGGTGFITVTLKNSGTDSGDKAIAKLSQSDKSPIIPVDGNVFLGNFSPGETVDAKFKVSVSKDAEPQEYPVSLLVNYQNADGETVDTSSEEIGIPIGSKVDFTVTSPIPEANPGQKAVISVTYRNDGSVPVYSAEARLSAVDPFTSNDDLAYLGNLKPGESATANFEISVDKGATIKSYGLDSEVKYRDALDESQVSDTIKIQISVTPTEGLASLLANPIVIAVIVILIVGIGYYIYNNRKAKPVR
jgi:hypothetical protein